MANGITDTDLEILRGDFWGLGLMSTGDRRRDEIRGHAERASLTQNRCGTITRENCPTSGVVVVFRRDVWPGHLTVRVTTRIDLYGCDFDPSDPVNVAAFSRIVQSVVEGFELRGVEGACIDRVTFTVNEDRLAPCFYVNVHAASTWIARKAGRGIAEVVTSYFPDQHNRVRQSGAVASAPVKPRDTRKWPPYLGECESSTMPRVLSCGTEHKGKDRDLDEMITARALRVKHQQAKAG